MSNDARRYVVLMAVVFGVALAAAAGVSLYVDPYRLFDVAGGWPEERPRPRATQQVQLAKAYGIAREKPRTLVLGNSRAEIGFDTADAAWDSSWQPVYNAATPGSWLKSDFESLGRAIAAGRVEHLVVGLEFVDFLTDPQEPLLPEDDSDMRPTPAVPGLRTAALKTLVTLDGLVDAALTVAAAFDAEAADITLRGFNPLHEYRVLVRHEGYGALFLQRDMENARNYARQPKSLYRAGTRSSTTLRYLARLDALARASGVDVTYVIYPYHAHSLELFHALGLWPLFEEWKARIVDVLDPAGDSGASDVCRVWDFSGYHAYAREPVPPLGDTRSELRWYWEAGHFKSTLGSLILQRILHGRQTEANGFGVCLTQRNLGADLARIRAEREDFVRDDPATVRRMADLASRARP